MDNPLVIRRLGRQDYPNMLQAMHEFTNQRDAATYDEVWLLQHNAVFTQGQAGKAEHLLNTGDIPVVQSDRGGQVTYHGPGQMVCYFLIDLRRKGWGARQLVHLIEQLTIDVLRDYGITAQAKPNAPGVYVNGQKICSLGLRIRKGCSFHGLALNVSMDLAPFLRINPCGYQGMEMTQIRHFSHEITMEQVETTLIHHLASLFGYQTIIFRQELALTGS